MQRNHLLSVLGSRPQAVAFLRGDAEHRRLSGLVRFHQLPGGVLISAEVQGLPTADAVCQSPLFAFHIHSGGACSGTEADPFADVGGHYDPYTCPHPSHAGDLPPLLGVNGRALSVFLTDRFTVREVLGRAVIIHAMPDDFVTQPSGNAGAKIACGIITPTAR